jgi:hypothetical protein
LRSTPCLPTTKKKISPSLYSLQPVALCKKKYCGHCLTSAIYSSKINC